MSSEQQKPETTAPEWKALHKAVDQCLLKDQFPLRRQIKQIRDLTEQEKPFEQHLEKLLNRVQKSQQIVQARSAELRISYPESLPVSGKREEILQAIQNHQVVVVAGETGSG